MQPELSEILEILSLSTSEQTQRSSFLRDVTQRQRRSTAVNALRELRISSERVIKSSDRASEAMRTAKITRTKQQKRYAYVLKHLKDDSDIR